MSSRISTIAAAFILTFIAVAAHAESAKKTETGVPGIGRWLDQETATGDWNGWRDKLKKDGIILSSCYGTDIGGNPSGGVRQEANYVGFLSAAVTLDFEKFASLKGMLLKISNILLTGSNLSKAVGDFYGVQQLYAPGNYYFGQLNLMLSALDDTFILETGRIFAGDVFAALPLFQYYLTGSINARLAMIQSDIFFPRFNIAAWGVRTTYQPNDNWYLMTGIYNADTKAAKVSNHGADFSFYMDDGFLAVGQLTYKHAEGRQDRGLPGSVSFGSYCESSGFEDLSDSSRKIYGNYGFYMTADQMIYKSPWPEGSGTPQESSSYFRNLYGQHPVMQSDRPTGLTLWGGWCIAPDDRINTQTYQIATGFIYQGLLPGRQRDVTAFCFVMGHFSDKLEGRSEEIVLELNHRLQLGPWCYITPDIQYVLKPSGRSDIENALVLGFETAFNF